MKYYPNFVHILLTFIPENSDLSGLNTSVSSINQNLSNYGKVIPWGTRTTFSAKANGNVVFVFSSLIGWTVWFDISPIRAVTMYDYGSSITYETDEENKSITFSQTNILAICSKDE